MYRNGWPDSYEEKEYNILDPSEAWNDTENFFMRRGFSELRKTMLREGFISFEKHLSPSDYRIENDDKLCVTITESGLVILGYDPKFIKRNEKEFDMHWNPIHLPISLAGSSKAIDDVVKRLFADCKLIERK